MKITEVFFDKQFDAINNTVRWNGLSKIKDETVAHHSYFVAMFTRLFAEELWPDKSSIQLEATTYAIFHDHDEMFTGDILHGFKHNKFNGNEIKKALKEYIKIVSAEKLLKRKTFSSELIYNFTSSGDIDPRAKFLVKYCDWLSMLFFLFKELKLGNKNVISTISYCVESTVNFLDKHASDFPLEVVFLQECFQEITNKINEYDVD